MNKDVFDVLEAFTHKDGLGTYAYVLAMADDNGEVTYHERTRQPCYGEMRIYNPKGWKPGDLHHPFPDGTPIGISVNLKGYHVGYRGLNTKSEGFKFVFGEDSLWAPLLSGRLVMTDDNDGFVMTSTDFDSDYWFSFLLTIRSIDSNSTRFDAYRNAAVSPLTAWVAAMQTQMRSQDVLFNPSNLYSMAYPCSFKNLLNRTPLSFQGGTFAERKTHRDRPDNMASRIWAGDDKFTRFNGTNSVPLEVFQKEVLPWMESFK